jgi:hypothetical protein
MGLDGGIQPAAAWPTADTATVPSNRCRRQDRCPLLNPRINGPAQTKMNQAGLELPATAAPRRRPAAEIIMLGCSVALTTTRCGNRTSRRQARLERDTSEPQRVLVVQKRLVSMSRFSATGHTHELKKPEQLLTYPDRRRPYRRSSLVLALSHCTPYMSANSLIFPGHRAHVDIH